MLELKERAKKLSEDLKQLSSAAQDQRLSRYTISDNISEICSCWTIFMKYKTLLIVSDLLFIKRQHIKMQLQGWNKQDQFRQNLILIIPLNPDFCLLVLIIRDNIENKSKVYWSLFTTNKISFLICGSWFIFWFFISGYYCLCLFLKLNDKKNWCFWSQDHKDDFEEIMRRYSDFVESEDENEDDAEESERQV